MMMKSRVIDLHLSSALMIGSELMIGSSAVAPGRSAEATQT